MTIRADWKLEQSSLPPVSEISLPPSELVNTQVGPMLLPAGDPVVTAWIREYGSWEEGESAALTALIRPGNHVIDVGAHVGYLTLLAAARVGDTGGVLAIEANPDNFELLRANLGRHGATHVRAVRAAAWRRSDETRTMTVSSENSGDHRVFVRQGATETLEVPTVALDDLVPEDWDVDVVKVDVQGTDHVAVEGMQRVIARCQPTILIEFWPLGIEEFGDPATKVLDFYRELGYDISLLEAPCLARAATSQAIVDVVRRIPQGFCTLLLRANLS
jgi:FkbM family methyltransferase